MVAEPRVESRSAAAIDWALLAKAESEREAMLFATDAAHKLGENGTETQVLRVDENGEASPAWTYGLDAYPPTP